jgi:formylglycine-generating enzyme required for sulfatase activity
LAIREQVNEKQKATHAAGLVQAVLNAETAQVPDIISKMAEYRQWTDPLLREEQNKAADKSAQQLHTSLALLPVDPGQAEYLYERLLGAQPHEVPVIRDALAPHKEAILERLWAVAEKPEPGPAKQRLRAAAALASYDPESAKWANVQTAVGDDLVKEPAVFLSNWLEALRPVRVRLLGPLSAVYASSKHRETERSLAADILADYAVDQPRVLADVVMNSDVQPFAIFVAKLKDRGEEGLPALIAEIDRKLPPEAKDDEKERLAKRQANAAVALLKMNQPAQAWQVFKHGPDPRARSYLIHWLAPLGVSARAIAQRVDEEPDVTIRRALLLSLGEFTEKEFSADERKLMLPKVQDIYRTAADPGLHASAEWLLRTWKQEAWLNQVNDEWAKDKDQRAQRLEGIGKALAQGKEQTPPQWYVNSQGQTMVVIPGPVEFVMGSPLSEADRYDQELQHTRRIGRTFALAAKSVTLEQYRRLVKGYSGPADFVRAGDLPAAGINWFMAAAYCNWLSKEEGIPEDQWCYEIKGQVTKLKASYLSLTGYRLPMEAEMEYATRAGAKTSRYFGETEALLPRYAWYEKNSQKRTWPVGSLKPNDLGLFDVQGNVYIWCQEGYKDYKEYIKGKAGEVVEDGEDDLVIAGTRGRVMRGGSFVTPASSVRSALRNLDVPAYRNLIFGFRPARTLPLGSFTALPPTAEGGRN